MMCTFCSAIEVRFKKLDSAHGAPSINLNVITTASKNILSHTDNAYLLLIEGGKEHKLRRARAKSLQFGEENVYKL